MSYASYWRKKLRRHPKRIGDKYKIQGSWMYLDDKDSLQLSRYGIYEKNETDYIKSILQPNYIVADIGANIGYYTLIMAKKVAHVYAFEPLHSNFEILKRNLNENNINNVSVYESAVAEHTGQSTLYLCETNRGMNRLYPSKWCNSQINVSTARLDDIVPRVDFVKMDIEGAELGALKGMTRILQEGTTLLLEFYPPSIREYGAEPKEIYELLQSYDYEIRIMNNSKYSSNDWPELEAYAIKHYATKQFATNLICMRKAKR